jgi:hypothetical protein
MNEIAPGGRAGFAMPGDRARAISPHLGASGCPKGIGNSAQMMRRRSPHTNALSPAQGGEGRFSPTPPVSRGGQVVAAVVAVDVGGGLVMEQRRLPKGASVGSAVICR